MDRKNGGLGGLNYPLLSDFNKQISRDYDVLVENAGLALRGIKSYRIVFLYFKINFRIMLSRFISN